MIAISPAGDSLPVTAELVAERLAVVRERVAAVGGPARVTVVAVTKGFDAGAVEAARAAGLGDVGENYAQELLAKAATSEGMRRHFLGAVQRNKVARLAPLVALWQGVDRPEVIDEIAARRPGSAVLVQVDVVGGAGRGGVLPAEVGGLVARGRDAGLDVRGLMCVGPAGDPPASRRAFEAVAAIGSRLGLAELSMGMTDDFELAVVAGSTMIRLGRALFGARPGRPTVRR